jgi:addiction module HigA family antidote
MDAERTGFEPDIAIPPGETLKETLDSLGVSQAELARRAGRPTKTINEIVKGKAAITADTALDLQRVLGIPARFWNNLERDFQETKARIRFEETLSHETRSVPKFPYSEMAKNGWVKTTRKPREEVAELLAFFGVSSLDKVVPTQAVFRAARGRNPSPHAMEAWLRRGQIQARDLRTDPFDARNFQEALAAVRGLTRQPIDKSQFELREICSGRGVVVVFVPHLRGTYVNGAARWLGPRRASIQLSLRYRYADVFWFTFFHEAGHILKHSKRSIFIEHDGKEETAEEREADDFASEMLMPRVEYAPFVEAGRFSATAVKKLASRIGVDPSIVVGRLQHDGHIPHALLNALRPKFTWAKRNS